MGGASLPLGFTFSFPCHQSKLDQVALDAIIFLFGKAHFHPYIDDKLGHSKTCRKPNRTELGTFRTSKHHIKKAG